MPEAAEIRAMFARVAPRYDRANRLLSAGVDQRWRRAAVAAAGVGPGCRVLDVCAGTCDLGVALARAGAAVVGADFCVPMLEQARVKRARGHSRLRLAAADAMALPFGDRAFDAVTVAFGIRNVADPVAALAEMRRVARPGGRVVVLEFARPRAPVIAGAYWWYFQRVLPRLGSWISGDRGAYRYLPDSVLRFPERGDFLALMQRAGLESATCRTLTCGIAALYRAEVRS